MEKSNCLREAKIFFASGQLTQCIDSFNTAEKQGENLLDICLSRGAAQIALGRFHEAEQDFTRVLQQDRENERAYYFRGIARVALKKFDSAVDDLTRSLVRNNNRGIAHLVRGLAYAELGEDQDAALDFNSASAFSEAEFHSFKKLFGDKHTPFQNTRSLLAKENAPWNNLLTGEAAQRLRNLMQ